MKTISLNGKQYDCPQRWEDVTLKQQMQVSVDVQKIVIEELKRFAILSGYCNIPIDELRHAKLQEVQKVFENMAFVNTPLPEKPLMEFDFKDSHYYCGQNLVEMEFQDFISIENTLQDYSGNTQLALPTILAIMCKRMKPNGLLESIDDYDINKRSFEFMELPVTTAHQLSLFFSLNEKLFSQLIPSFSIQQNQEAILQKQIEEVESTLKELDGKGWLMRCVTGILRYSLKYTKRLLDKHSTSTV